MKPSVAVVSSNESTKPVVITNGETPTTPPNYYLRDLDKGTTAPITNFTDPTPQIRGIKKQLVKYERSDGVSPFQPARFTCRLITKKERVYRCWFGRTQENSVTPKRPHKSLVPLRSSHACVASRI